MNDFLKILLDFNVGPLTDLVRRLENAMGRGKTVPGSGGSTSGGSGGGNKPDPDYVKELNSVKGLNAEIKKLKEVRDVIVVSTDKEKKAVKDINDEIDKHSKKVKELTAVTKNLDDTTTQKVKELTAVTKNLDDTTTKSKGGFLSMAMSLIGMGSAFEIGSRLVSGFVNTINSSINTIKTFSTTSNELSSITGATGTQLAFLEKSAIEMSGGMEQGAVTINQSSDKILEAFKKVASAKPELLENAQALKEVAKEAIIFSQAGGKDLPLDQAVLALTQTLNQFGAPAEDAGKFINVLAAGAKFGAAEVPYLNAAIVKVGSVAESANVSIEQLTAAMEVFGEKGIVAETAGMGFKQILVKLQGDTKNYTNGVFDLNKAIDNNKNIQNDNIKLQKKFGQEYFNVAQILFKNSDRFKELTKNVTGTNVAYEQATTNTKGLAVATEMMGNKWDAFVLSLDRGDGFISTITSGFVDMASAIISSITPTISLTESLSTEQNQLNMLVTELKNTTEGTTERAKVIGEIQAIYPDFLKNIDQEKNYNSELDKELAKVNKQYQTKFEIASLDDVIKKQEKELANSKKRVENMQDAIQASDLLFKLEKERDALYKKTGSRETPEYKALSSRIMDLTPKAPKADIGEGATVDWEKIYKKGIVKGIEDIKTLQSELDNLNTQKSQQELIDWGSTVDAVGKKVAKDFPSAGASAVAGFKKAIANNDFGAAKIYKITLERYVKNIDNAKKENPAAEMNELSGKEEEERKKTIDRLNALEKLRLENMKDGREKDLTENKQKMDEDLRAFEVLNLLKVGEAKKAIDLISKIDKGETLTAGDVKLKAQLENDKAYPLLLERYRNKQYDINKKWDIEDVTLAENMNVLSAEIEKKGESELLSIKINGEKEILKTLEQNEKTPKLKLLQQKKVILDLEKQTYEAKSAALDKQFKLDNEYADASVGTVQGKERKKFEIYLNYAEARLKLAETEFLSDGLLSDEEKAKLKALQTDIANTKNSLGNVGKKKPKFGSTDWGADLFKIKEEDKAAFGESWDMMKNTVANSVSSMIGELDRYMDRRVQAVEADISASENKVNSLQGELDKENELKKQGLANNSAAKEKEVNTEKERLKALMVEKEKAVKQKIALQKIEMLAESGMQTADMITASTSIWKFATAATGPFAIPLAIGSIALMWTSFLASKAMMLKELNSQKFAEGVIDLQGPGTETSDSIPAKLSKGESVMTAKETKHSRKILDMIREGSLNDNLLARLPAMLKVGEYPNVTVNNDFSELHKEQKRSNKLLEENNNLLKNTRIFSADGTREMSVDGLFERVRV